jgi:transposase
MLKFIVGADVSKDKINFSLLFDGKVVSDHEISNKVNDLTMFVKSVQSLAHSLSTSNVDNDVYFCMEHTGVYNNLLYKVLDQAKITFFVEPGLHIKLTLGLTRGKNDKIDARRIAEFCNRNHDKLVPHKIETKLTATLKALQTKRNQYVKMKCQLSQGSSDNKVFLDAETSKMIKQSDDPLLKSIIAAIKKIDAQIEELIKTDPEIMENYKIAQSVPGVGKVLATAMICATSNFNKFDHAKKFATYCGVVPFNNESGKKKGKSKVSHLANKDLKKLLHLSATSTIKSNSSFAIYYQKKVEQGKNKMLVLNNIRNKIVHTVFACIKSKIKYSKQYQYNPDIAA